MAQYTGKDLIVSLAGAALTARFTSFTTKEEIKLVDQSAANDVAATYLTSLEDGDAKLELLDQRDGTAATAIWNKCDKGTEGSLMWQPEGTATGDPKHWVNAIVKTREREFPFDDVVKITVSFQFSGVVTDTAN